MEKISIIIPAFNEGFVIGRLLKSINRQDYKAIETIVIDDGSSDDTGEIAKKLGSKVYMRKHAERSVQRNFGAKKSNGKLLFFLDADMELMPGVITDCVRSMKSDVAALVIPERTVGNGLIPRIRRFEREMYMGDPTIEVARVFKREVFFKYGGYDSKLTGPEDYDLPYRISKKYKIGRGKIYILHHEENLSLLKLLKKKYYYAQKGAFYAKKHPELLRTQGNTLFRKSYFRNWRKFLKNPVDGICFIFVRIFETITAISGYISVVGIDGFFLSFTKMLFVDDKNK